MQGPIPGQSLTAEPGSQPYENPPRFAKPEEAFEAYLDKFDDPDTQDALFQILENGVPLESVVTMLTRQAVNGGIHSVDVSIILRPVVHEYLSVLADAAGVDYEEAVGDNFKKTQIPKRERVSIATRVNKQMASREETEDDDLEGLEMEEPEMTAPDPIEAPVQPPKRGLMTRPEGNI